jgi:plasmid maintenance system antidote protein VapI
MKVNAPPPPLTPGDIRAALARFRIPLYQLAAQIHVHPARLSPMIHERVPLPASIAERIARVLAEQGAAK